VETKASSVARSLKLGTSTSVNTCMGDHQGRPYSVNLGRSSFCDRSSICRRYRADTDVKMNQTEPRFSKLLEELAAFLKAQCFNTKITFVLSGCITGLPITYRCIRMFKFCVSSFI